MRFMPNVMRVIGTFIEAVIEAVIGAVIGALLVQVERPTLDAAAK